jgi:hypothetical protein
MTFGHEQLDVYHLNSAEGNGKATDGDRRRFFEMPRGSALECGAVQDVLNLKSGVRVMISLGGVRRGGRILREDSSHTFCRPPWRNVCSTHADYGIARIDTDSDSDPDADKS